MQPANQPAKLSTPRTNLPTTNPPTQKSTAKKPTRQGAMQTWGRGIHNLGGGGTKHTTTTLTQPVGGHSPKGGGGVAREEGWWRGVTCTTPQAHTPGKREGVTHLPVNTCPRRSHFSNALSKKSHTCKKVTKTLPHLRPNMKVNPTTHTAKCEGRGEGARTSGGVCAVFVCDLLPPSPPSTYCGMCCGVHMPMQNCVCGGGGGDMRMHASSVLVAMSVCAVHPSTLCDNLLFVFYLFCHSKLERYAF